MPAIEQIAALYDFAFIFENALKSLLTANELKAYTSQFIPKSGNADTDAANVAAGFELLDFQRDRPRSEIQFLPGAAAGPGRITLLVDGSLRPVQRSWAGGYNVRVVTRPDIRFHNQSVVFHRYLLATLPPRLNGGYLTKHMMHEEINDAGATPTTKAEDGAFETVLAVNFTFSIQADAWAELTT